MNYEIIDPCHLNAELHTVSLKTGALLLSEHGFNVFYKIHLMESFLSICTILTVINPLAQSSSILQVFY